MEPTKKRDAEHKLQVACFQYFRLAYKPYADSYFAIANGGKRHIVVAIKLKREGVVKGVFDTFLAIPAGKYAGLWIEFKDINGRLTPEQKVFQARMDKNGYKTAVIKDLDGFIVEMKNYFKEII